MQPDNFLPRAVAAPPRAVVQPFGTYPRDGTNPLWHYTGAYFLEGVTPYGENKTAWFITRDMWLVYVNAIREQGRLRSHGSMVFLERD